MRTKPESILRKALTANAAFSTASAVGCIAAASSLPSHIAQWSSDFIALGIQLIVFAAALIFVAKRVSATRRWTLAAAAFFGVADMMWLLGSAMALRCGVALTPFGSSLVIGVAVVVGSLGVVQLISVAALIRQRRTLAEV
jgi:hypothetical protein